MYGYSFIKSSWAKGKYILPSISDPRFQFKVFLVDLIHSKNYWIVLSSGNLLFPITWSRFPITGTWSRVKSLKCRYLTIPGDTEAAMEKEDI